MITADIASVKQVQDFVVSDPELYDRLADDNCPPIEEFIVPEQGYDAIGGYLSGKLVSLFIVHDEKLHFMVLKPYRRHAVGLLDASFKLWPHNVHCKIASCYKSVINFAKNYGFKETEIIPLSFMKNGILHDVHKLIYEVQ